MLSYTDKLRLRTIPIYWYNIPIWKFWGQYSKSSFFYCPAAFGIGANSIGTQA